MPGALKLDLLSYGIEPLTEEFLVLKNIKMRIPKRKAKADIGSCRAAGDKM
jgi:hypothetical protein